MLSDEPALSVRQPWAELIVAGRKTLELRTWQTDYRGRIWLHTGQNENHQLDRLFGIVDPPRGAFIGSVEIKGISRVDEQRWRQWAEFHLDPGYFRPGLFAWTLLYPKRFAEPVPARGNVGLFPVESEILRALMRAPLSQ